MPHSGGGGLVLWQNDWFSETCDFSSGDSTLNQTMQTTPVKDNTHRKNKCSAPDPLGGPVPYFGTHCASSSDTINASIGFMSVQYSASTSVQTAHFLFLQQSQTTVYLPFWPPNFASVPLSIWLSQPPGATAWKLQCPDRSKNAAAEGIHSRKVKKLSQRK